ncbi:MAG: DNA cytosine methyltransferase [Magnetococcales bacterium]|nr:DNA cytosine methyltransferase [Magnetococcales bacterium]
MTCLDLFCGAGGSSEGARQAGCEIVGAVDAWDMAIATYRDNHLQAGTGDYPATHPDAWQWGLSTGDAGHRESPGIPKAERNPALLITPSPN